MKLADAKKVSAFCDIPFSTSANSQLRNWQMRRENKMAFSDTFQLHSTVDIHIHANNNGHLKKLV